MRSLPTRLLGVTAAGALLASLAAVNAAAADPAPVALVQNNETQPVYGMSDAITLKVNIQTGVDTDKDGHPDTVQLRLKRPHTAAGVKVPTIIEPSPYNYTQSDRLPYHETQLKSDGTPSIAQYFADQFSALFPDADPNQDPDVPAVNLPQGAAPVPAKADMWDMTWESWFDNYFVPRGYAVADLDALGTGKSTGCPNPGSSNEQAGVKAAVDWLNGSAVGTDENGNPVTATDWSNGSVALKGKSYDGALSVEGAASGVKGLKTVVSVAGIPDWYRYSRSNGMPVAPGGANGYDLDNLATFVNSGPSRAACKAIIASNLTDKVAFNSGDRTAFWNERNYASSNALMNTKASVFLIQGTRDETVRPEGTLSYWQALQQYGIPSKLWTFQGTHMRPYQLRRDEYVRQMHLWYDHWLYNLDNGIMDEPKVDVQKPDLSGWTTQSSWPAPEATNVTLKMHADGSLSSGYGGLSVSQSMTDKGDAIDTESVLDPNGASNADSLAYITPKLTDAVTLEGFPSFSVNASLNGPSPYLTALLVDYGPQKYTAYSGSTSGQATLCDGVADGTNTGCSAPYTTGIYYPTSHPNFRVVARGWLDGRNYMNDSTTSLLTDGSVHQFQWKGQPTEYTVPAGHQLGVVLVSSDKKYTPRYVGTSGTESSTLTARTEFSSVTLPVKAGGAALGG
ncbi:CocE/NonD family hydrolase [Kitasatospora paranensis]|uniref:Xaa-Pro dipeptidyl-peptidase n=1 Tax=Kitasatospora paranensis TaxID=258053 RepID=A0ABW2G0T2_9ACTN